MNEHVSLLEKLAPISHFVGREEQNFSFFIDFSVLVEKVFSSSFVLSPDCFRTVLVVCHSTVPYLSAFWRVQFCTVLFIFEYLVNINIFLFHCLNVFIVFYSHFHNLNVFYCLQLHSSEFLVQFHQFLSVEPEVGVANVYVMSVFVRDDFYLFHIFRYLKSSCCG